MKLSSKPKQRASLPHIITRGKVREVVDSANANAQVTSTANESNNIKEQLIIIL